MTDLSSWPWLMWLLLVLAGSSPLRGVSTPNPEPSHAWRCADWLAAGFPLPYVMPVVIRLGRWVYGERDVLWQARTSEKVIALTFDDGPSTASSLMPSLLDVLRKQRVRCTFFVLGDRLGSEAEQQILWRAHRDGHEIALHGLHHTEVTRMSSESLREDYQENRRRVEGILGTASASGQWYVRPPWGKLNRRARSVFAELKMRVVNANIVPGQMTLHFKWNRLPWAQYREHTEKVVPRILRELQPGSIIALHTGEQLGGRTDRVWDSDQAARTAEMLIPALRARGYRFVTVSELEAVAREAHVTPKD